MDSTTVTTTGGAGLDALYVIMPQLVGGLIVPLTAWLKKFKFAEVIRPEFIKGILATGAAFGLVALLELGLTPAETIRFGLEAVGTAAIVYGGVKTVTKGK